ncbi:MAG: orotate phosphoribosyltransferase [Candidatus Nealsonbacteria bacterium]|nr:orotate phosphoribosyltransferase [Candidatus Nealsonbacteria bacterium]
MGKNKIEAMFEQCGAILAGHFILTSGRHSDRYLEKALVYTDPERVSNLCFDLGSKVRGIRIEAVVGPAVGGVGLSLMTAYHIASLANYKVLSLFTEKNKEGKQTLKRGYQKLIAGKKVLIVDDILTTGGSVKEVADEVARAGGKVVAVAVLCNRGGIISEKLGYPLLHLWETNIESWTPEFCPLCQKGIPITNLK